MAVTIHLSPETEKRLQELAARAGQSLEHYLARLAEKEAWGANGAQPSPRPEKTFDEILAPVRQGWEEAGMSEEQVDQLFEDTLQKVRQGPFCFWSRSTAARKARTSSSSFRTRPSRSEGPPSVNGS
jgi:hypothetical protein